MYVCVCHAVTERDIDSAIAAGCCSLRQLREELGVGACCGCCATCVREKLKDVKQPRAHHSTTLLQFAAA
jgi:bacterioferritin-associated ferredoxin